MRKKTKPMDKTMSLDPEELNPGPGAYENPEIDLKKSSYSSRFNRLSYSSSRSKRFGDYGKFFCNFR